MFKVTVTREKFWELNRTLYELAEVFMCVHDQILENPDLVNRATTPFSELQFPSSTEEPNSFPSTDDDTGEATDIIVFEDVDHNASSMEPMMISDANL